MGTGEAALNVTGPVCASGVSAASLSAAKQQLKNAFAAPRFTFCAIVTAVCALDCVS